MVYYRFSNYRGLAFNSFNGTSDTDHVENLAQIFRRSGVALSDHTGLVEYTNPLNGELVPLPLPTLVAGRQASLTRMPHAVLQLRFHDDEDEMVWISPPVRVAGVVTDYGELADAGIRAAVMDALVLHAGSLPVSVLRAVLQARYVRLHRPESGEDLPCCELDNAHTLFDVTRSSILGEFLRQVVQGDLDTHMDESEDLPWLVDTEMPTSQRRFGLEFEWLPNGYGLEHYGAAVTAALTSFGESGRVLVTGYAHSDGQTWHVKTDSSCGFELATPALTWRDWPKVEAVLRALYAAGGRIDDRCGFHVHHEARDLRAPGLRRLLLLWMAYEPVLLSSVKAERRGNRYCRMFRDSVGSWDDFKRQVTPLHNMERLVRELGRYQALNATGWWQHGRVEVRLHHGTLHPMACRFWVLLTQQMIEFAKVTRSYNELESAFSQQFDAQVQNFKQAVVFHSGNKEVLQLPAAIDTAIQRRREPVEV